MAECLHKPLCPNECPCDYMVTQKDADYTVLIPDFKGACIVYAHCANCDQPVQYPTDKPYNVCPYCGKRIFYKEET